MKTRVFKFRIWDKGQKEFIYKHAAMFLNLEGKVVNYKRRELPEVVDIPEHLIFQQFTGLKDKNGVDIYEGDLVEFYSNSHKRTFEVMFGEYDGDIDRHCGWNFSGMSFVRDVTVVGNVFETPDLIP